MCAHIQEISIAQDFGSIFLFICFIYLHIKFMKDQNNYCKYKNSNFNATAMFLSSHLRKYKKGN